jgi:hypothetical protein
MGKTLAELIDDAASNDDLQFKMPDGTEFRLGDVRMFKKGKQSEEAALKAKREEAEKIATEADTILKSLQLAMKEAEKNKTPPNEPKTPDWRKNPLYEDLLPVFDELTKTASEARAQAAEIKKSLDQSQAIYALERMRRQWAEAKAKPKDKKFEEVVAEVLGAKELDEMGLPTLEKYLYRTSEPDRMKVAVEEAVGNARKEWEKTARAASIPKPGATHIRAAAKDAPIKNLTELTSELVANDPDIVALNEGQTN